MVSSCSRRKLRYQSEWLLFLQEQSGWNHEYQPRPFAGRGFLYEGGISMLKMKLKDGAVREVAEGTTIAEFVKNVSAKG